MKTEIINYFDKALNCTPMNPMIFDTYLEGATGGVINKNGLYWYHTVIPWELTE